MSTEIITAVSPIKHLAREDPGDDWQPRCGTVYRIGGVDWTWFPVAEAGDTAAWAEAKVCRRCKKVRP